MSLFKRRKHGQAAFAHGEVAPLSQTLDVVTRFEDHHTICRWIVSKGDVTILSVDMRAEHARAYGERFTAVADEIDMIAPDQDWSYDPIRDAWENR